MLKRVFRSNFKKNLFKIRGHPIDLTNPMAITSDHASINTKQITVYHSCITPDPSSSSPSYHAANWPGVMPRCSLSKMT